MPNTDPKPLSAAVSRVTFRAGLASGAADVPAPFDVLAELRQARSGILSEVARLNRVRHEIAVAPMTDDQRAEHTQHVTSEIRGLTADWRTMGGLMQGIRRRRRADYLAAANDAPGTAAE